MSWDNEKALSFIKGYEKRPILWQKSDNFYHNVIKKEAAWREIGEICDEDIAVLKTKLRVSAAQDVEKEIIFCKARGQVKRLGIRARETGQFCPPAHNVDGGRPRNQQRAVQEEAILEAVENDPTSSYRSIALEVGTSKNTDC
ncbi:hypothetical protein ABEB36_009427 [Hypothenemus hampei]|uniref:MADF domain-containing protein n=1 Tax=Hypothenemus hampei TaxID=57062 RepID=A0ABD1EIF5_HYPHA